MRTRLMYDVANYDLTNWQTLCTTVKPVKVRCNREVKLKFWCVAIPEFLYDAKAGRVDGCGF